MMWPHDDPRCSLIFQCRSTFHMQGNQKLNLGVPSCTDCGTAIHELLHSMGMAHEQSRPDRDTFVEIKWDNIIGSMFSQFAKNPQADTSVDYDIMSIMHDGRFHWSHTGKETILVKEAGYRLYTDDPEQYHVYAIGQHVMMTENDVRQLAKMYNCTSNTTCGTGRTDVQNVDGKAPGASIKACSARRLVENLAVLLLLQTDLMCNITDGQTPSAHPLHRK